VSAWALEFPRIRKWPKPADERWKWRRSDGISIPDLDRSLVVGRTHCSAAWVSVRRSPRLRSGVYVTRRLVVLGAVLGIGALWKRRLRGRFVQGQSRSARNRRRRRMMRKKQHRK